MFKKISMLLIIAVFITGIGSLLYAMSCHDKDSGYNQHQQVAQAQSEQASGTVALAGATSKEAVNAGNKICPVLNERIEENMKASYEYEGKIYNFCCSMCIDAFKKDPQKYIKKVNDELQVKPKEAKQDSNNIQGSEMPMDMQGGHHH